MMIDKLKAPSALEGALLSLGDSEDSVVKNHEDNV